MRPAVKQFVEICSQTLLVDEPIYEFGSFQVPGHKGYADLRPFFPHKKYIGADIREGPGVDVNMNVTQTDLVSESVGTVLILDTLEHVEFLRKAMEEVYRILTTKGFLIISSVMYCPIHDNHDYWRFTPEGFESLLKPFAFSHVDSIGNPKFPHTVLGIASKSLIHKDLLNEFTKQFESLKHHKKERTINLNDLALKYGNAKGSNWLNYMTEYEKYFAPLKEKKLTLLELGVGKGTSLKIWGEYFKQAKIYGIDINPSCKQFEDERTQIFTGLQQDIPFLESVCDKIGGKLDIIIDDCGHRPDNQITSFKFFYPQLKRGGLYAIEDVINTSIEKVADCVAGLRMEILFIQHRYYTDIIGRKRKVNLLIGRKK